MTDKVLEAMKDYKSHDLDALKVELKDSPTLAGVISPGRSIHGALMSLRKRGIVELTEDKKWVRVRQSVLPLNGTQEHAAA